jgi:hypothetical protein
MYDVLTKTLLLHDFVGSLADLIKGTQLKCSLLALACCTQFLVQIRTISVKIPFLNVLAQQFIEKLGDSKDRVRESALTALVELFITVSMHESQTQTLSPSRFTTKLENMIITRAFGSKVPKAREGGVQFVLRVSKTYTIPLKPFVPSLIKLLEDSNELVRQVAKQSIMELSQYAKSEQFEKDVIKELSKQGIRSSIVDSITSQFQKPTENSAGIEANESLAEPSLEGLHFASEHDLRKELGQLVLPFDGKETEQNWSERDASLQRLSRILRGNGPTFGCFVPAIREWEDHIVSCLASLRSALSLTACTLIQDMSSILGSKMDQIAEHFVAPLIKASSSSKKLIANAALLTSKTMITHTSFNSKIFALYVNSLSDKSPSVRQGCVECIRLLMELISLDFDAKSAVERAGLIDSTYNGLKKSLQDPDGMVRSFGREAYYFFSLSWPDKATALFGELDVSGQKAISKSKSPPASAFKTPSKKLPSAPHTPTQQSSKADQVKISSPAVQLPAPDLDDVLESFGRKELEGLVGVLSYAQENMGLIPTELQYRIQTAFLNLLKETCPESFLEGMVHSQTALLLQEAGVVTLDDLLIPYLKIYFGTTNETIREQVEQFLYDYKSTRELDGLIKELVQRVNTISTVSFKKKSAETKQVEKAVRHYVLEWIHSLLVANENGQEVDLDTFFDETTVRLFLNRLVPLALQFPNSVDICSKVFRIVHSFGNEFFEKVLDTFDLDNAHLVKQMIGLMDTEDLSIEEMEEMDEEFGRVTVDQNQDLKDDVGNRLENEGIHHQDQLITNEEHAVAIGSILTASEEISELIEGQEEDVLNESLPAEFEEPSVMLSEGDKQGLLDIPIREGPSGLVGTKLIETDRPEEDPSIKAPALGRLQSYLDEIVTPKRPAARGDFQFLEPNDQTPKQVRFSDPRDELKELIVLYSQNKDIDVVAGRLYQFSRRYPCNALDKSGSVFWGDAFADFLSVLIAQIAEPVETDRQEKSLLLLKSVIMNQSDLVVGHEKALFLHFFACRSDGSPEVKLAHLDFWSSRKRYACAIRNLRTKRDY